MLALFNFIATSVQFIVFVTLALLFMILRLLILFTIIAIFTLIVLTFTRRIPVITLWDLFCDFHIIPVLEKGAVIIVFACFFATAGSSLDNVFGTPPAFSLLIGIIGAVVGFRVLYII